MGLSNSNLLQNQITLQGAGSIGSLDLYNSNMINANSGGSLTIAPFTSFSNFGTAQATNGSTLTLNNYTATIYNAGTIQASNGTVVVNGGNINNSSGGVLQATSGGTLTLNNYSGAINNNSGGMIQTINGGTLNLNNYSVINNAGTIQASGSLTIVNGGAIYNNSGGMIQATNGSTLTLNNYSGTIYNAGTIQASNGFLVLNGGTINNSSGIIQAQNAASFSEVDLDNGVVINGGSLVSGTSGFFRTYATGAPPILNGVTIAGSYAVLPSAAAILQGTTVNSAQLSDYGQISNSGVFNNIDGTLIIYPGASFVGVPSGTSQRTESFRQSGFSTTYFFQGATLSSLTGVWLDGGTIFGNATITAPWLHVAQLGIVNEIADRTPDTLTINGGYMQSGGGTPGVLQIYLYSPTSYDEVAVHGTAWLHGNLWVTLQNNFTPLLGERFTIMTYDLRKGRFDTLSLPGLPSYEKWSVDYLPRSVVLSVVQNGIGPSPEFSSFADSGQRRASSQRQPG